MVGKAWRRTLGHAGAGREDARSGVRRRGGRRRTRLDLRSNARGSTLERSATSGSPVSRDQSKMLCVGVGDDKPDRSASSGKKVSDRRTFALESERLIGKTIVLKGKNKFRRKNKTEGKRQNNVWGPPWTPTRISSRPLRVFGRRRARWMRYRRLDVPVQKDGEGSEGNNKKKAKFPPGFEPGIQDYFRCRLAIQSLGC